MSAQIDLAQIHLLQAVRDFFGKKGFHDVLTPPAVLNPGMETHLHPFRLARAISGENSDLYLHTSPEFFMKKLLSLGLEKIFTISYCFRDEPSSIHHRSQFLMLEWYRANSRYEQIMDDCQDLLNFSLKRMQRRGIAVRKGLGKIHLEKKTVQEIFMEFLHFDILNFLDAQSLAGKIAKDFPDVPLPVNTKTLEWDDLYFLLFLNKIEPNLARHPFLLLYEFPCHLAALSTLKKNDPRVAERFEIYAFGIELCNCFNELCDLDAQKMRLDLERRQKERLYGYSLPTPHVLYDALKRGLAPSAGIAMGIERLHMALTDTANPFWTWP